jgi:hypothetical protein
MLSQKMLNNLASTALDRDEQFPVDNILMMLADLTEWAASHTYGFMELQCLVEGIRLCGDNITSLPLLRSHAIDYLRELCHKSRHDMRLASSPQCLAYINAKNLATVCAVLLGHLRLNVTLFERQPPVNGKLRIRYHAIHREASRAPQEIIDDVYMARLFESLDCVSLG